MSQEFENSTPNPETVNVFLNNKLNDEELNAIVSLDDIQKTISLINSGGNGSFDPDVIDRLGKKMDKFELHTPIPQLYIAANIHIRKHLNPYVHATADEYDCVIKLKKQLAMRLIAKNTTNVFRRVKALPKSTTVEELKLLQDLIGEINFFEFDMLDMATAGVDILRELDFKRRASNFTAHFSDGQARLIQSIGNYILSLASRCPADYENENKVLPVEAFFDY